MQVRKKDIYKGIVSSYPILEIKDDFSLYSSHRGGRVKLPHERVEPTQDRHIPSTQMLKPCSHGHRARVYLCMYAVMPLSALVWRGMCWCWNCTKARPAHLGRTSWLKEPCMKATSWEPYVEISLNSRDEMPQDMKWTDTRLLGIHNSVGIPQTLISHITSDCKTSSAVRIVNVQSTAGLLLYHIHHRTVTLFYFAFFRKLTELWTKPCSCTETGVLLVLL